MPTGPTRGLILERAIAVIETQGEAALRVRDLAAECGVTSPILYRHFGSREGLVVEVQATRYWQSHLQVFEVFDPFTQAAGSAEDLRSMLDAFLDYVFSPERAPYRRLRASVLGSAVGRPDLADAIRAADASFTTRLSELLRPFQERGWIRQDLPLEAFGIWYLGQLDGRIHLELGDVPFDPADWNLVSRRALNWLVFGVDDTAV